MQTYPTELAELDSLTPHPRNYRKHPPAQLAHIKASIREHGVYRNIVVARDGTILAGHGVAQAARELGMERVPVIRLPLEATDTKAIKLVIADNEIEQLGEVDDAVLAGLLRDVFDVDDLLGTGYDDASFSSLLAITRAPSEVDAFLPADEWVGMPEFKTEDKTAFRSIVMHFKDQAAVDEFTVLLNKTISPKARYLWFPEIEIDSVAEVRYASDES